MNKENKRIIEALESKYSGDAEALEIIEQAKKDIEYIERKEAAGGYTGQLRRDNLSGNRPKKNNLHNILTKQSYCDII